MQAVRDAGSYLLDIFSLEREPERIATVAGKVGLLVSVVSSVVLGPSWAFPAGFVIGALGDMAEIKWVKNHFEKPIFLLFAHGMSVRIVCVAATVFTSYYSLPVAGLAYGFSIGVLTNQVLNEEDAPRGECYCR